MLHHSGWAILSTNVPESQLFSSVRNKTGWKHKQLSAEFTSPHCGQKLRCPGYVAVHRLMIYTSCNAAK